MLPRQRRRPFTMMASRVHSASHSSMLRTDTQAGAGEGAGRRRGRARGVVRAEAEWGAERPGEGRGAQRLHLCDVSTTERPVLMRSRMRFQRKRRALGSMPVVGSSWGRGQA